jgi:hydrogenase 3 maturation protease
MKKGLVLTVGNTLMGDDAAGPMLATMIRHSPLKDWEVLDGGSVPEDCVSQIREAAPEQVLIFDAADMNMQPGEIRLIDKDEIGNLFLVTTHSLPLTYLIEALQDFVPRVDLIGVQPEVVAFGFPVSAHVRQAVERVYAWLQESDERTPVLKGFPGLILDDSSHGNSPEHTCASAATSQ